MRIVFGIRIMSSSCFPRGYIDVNIIDHCYQLLLVEEQQVIDQTYSFRHHQAKKYQLDKGYIDGADYNQARWAVCDTRRSLGRLQQYLLDSFLRAQVPIVGISPFDFIIDEIDFQGLFKRLEYLLSRGFVPILHGDILLDREKHWRIFSGDDLLLKLAEHFQARLCVFLTSVDGVLRRDGSVIEMFDVDQTEFDQIDGSSNNIDVTGSMKNKISIASQIVNKLNHCHVFIVGGTSENAKKLFHSSMDEIENDSTFILQNSTRIVKKKRINE